jgi:hypothetical protein
MATADRRHGGATGPPRRPDPGLRSDQRLSKVSATGPIRSTHSVPHATNAIMLDDPFAAALRNEVSDPMFPETPA